MVKNLPASTGDIRKKGSIPGSGRSRGKKMPPTPVPLPGEPHGERSRAGYSPWGGVVKSGTRDAWSCAACGKYRCKSERLVKASAGVNQFKSLE